MSERNQKAKSVYMPENFLGGREKFHRFANRAFAYSCLFVAVPGYFVYFSGLNVSGVTQFQWLLKRCQSCEARFVDLQRYDGVSGEVYLIVSVSFIIASVFVCIGVLRLFLTSLRAGEHKSQHAGPPKGTVAFAIVAMPLIYYVAMFVPSRISSSPYPGMSRILIGAIYPVLMGAIVMSLPLLLLPVVVFFKKLIKG